MYRDVEFTREELLAKVWATPVLRLAKEIGASDVALSKGLPSCGDSLADAWPLDHP